MIVDSVVWIALKYEKDKYHLEARNLIPEIFKEKPVVVSDYIISEVYSFLLRKTSFEIAQNTLEMFVSSDKVSIIYNDKDSFQETLEIVKRYPYLSIVDANIVLHAQKMKLEYLSFDERLSALQKENSQIGKEIR